MCFPTKSTFFFLQYLPFFYTHTHMRSRAHTHIYIFSFTFISLIPSTHDRKFSLFYPPDIVFPQTFLSLRPNIAKFDNYANRLGKIKKKQKTTVRFGLMFIMLDSTIFFSKIYNLLLKQKRL